MALTERLSDEAANAEIDAITALLDGGFLDLYDGAQPATGNTAITTQTRLASLQFGTPAFAAGVAGVATANPITADPLADASGTASWYRMWKANHTSPVQDGSVGVTGCNLNMGATGVVIVVATPVAVDSFMLTASKV